MGEAAEKMTGDVPPLGEGGGVVEQEIPEGVRREQKRKNGNKESMTAK